MAVNAHRARGLTLIRTVLICDWVTLLMRK